MKVIIALAVVTGLVGCSSERAAQKEVADRLLDPSSAEFRNVESFDVAGVPYTCGEVNANNAMGGKTGFKVFAHKPGKVLIDGPGVDFLDVLDCCVAVTTQSPSTDSACAVLASRP